MIVDARGKVMSRRAVRGHRVVFRSLDPVPSGDGRNYLLLAHCDRCRTEWRDFVGWLPFWKRDDKRFVCAMVERYAASKPTCEAAYQDMVARDVMEG